MAEGKSSKQQTADNQGDQITKNDEFSHLGIDEKRASYLDVLRESLLKQTKVKAPIS